MHLLLSLWLAATSLPAPDSICIYPDEPASLGAGCEPIELLMQSGEPVEGRRFVHRAPGIVSLGILGSSLPATAADLPPGRRIRLSVAASDPDRWPRDLRVEVAAAGADRPNWRFSLKADEVARWNELRLPEGTWDVRFEGAGHKPQTVRLTPSLERGSRTITLAAHPLLTGRVVDTEDNPLFGVLVASVPPGHSALTDAQGRFSIEIERDVPEFVTMDFPPFGRAIVPVRNGSRDQDIGEIVMRAGGAISLETDLPAPATLRLYAMAPLQKGPEVHSEALPEGPHTVQLSGLGRGHYGAEVTGEGPLQRMFARFLVREGDMVPVELKATPIELELVAEDVEGPCAHATVKLSYDSPTGWSEELALDERGEWRGEVWQAGTLTAVVRRKGDPFSFFADREMRQRRERWVIRVEAPTIRGRITDADSGQPVADADLLLVTSHPRGQGTRRGKSDAQGEFTFGNVQAGENVLTVQAATYPKAEEGFTTTLGERERLVDVRLRREPVKTLQVMRGGSPVPGAAAVDSLTLWPLNSDAAGRIAVPVEKGSSRLLFVLTSEGELATVRLSSDGPAERTIDMAALRPATILVRAQDQDGAPLGQVSFDVSYEGTVWPRLLVDLLGKQGVTVQTDGRGEMRLPAVPPGNYLLIPRGRFTGEGVGQQGAEVPVKPGVNQTTLTFRRPV